MSGSPTPSSPPTASAPPDVVDVAADLRLGATRLARRLRQEVEVRLTPSLHSALVSIHVHGPMTLGELAEHERVTPPTVTKVVGRLEEQGLVERIADTDDRRVCRVGTTPAGDELLEESRAAKNAWLAGRIRDLPVEDLEVLRRAAELVESIVDDRR